MEKIDFSFVNLLNIITLFVTMLFIFQVYTLKKRSTSNNCFILYLANILVIVFFFLILDLNYTKLSFALIPLLMLSVLSIGPLLCLYIKLVTGGNLKYYKKHFYIPFGFFITTIILATTNYFIEDEAISKLINNITTYIVSAGLSLFFVTQNGYYIYVSLKRYKKHLRNIEERFSYTEKVNLSWFKLLIYGYIFFILGLIICHLVDDSISYILFYIILLSYVLYSGYNALKQEPLFEVSLKTKKATPKKNNDNEIDPELKENLKKILIEKMEKDKIYLDSSLTINTVSSAINSNNKYVSQLINNDFNQNFVMFVNSYRIREAKKLLLDNANKNLTIESIGYDVGFKSKSAFNRVFKQFTAQTPSQFKITHQ